MHLVRSLARRQSAWAAAPKLGAASRRRLEPGKPLPAPAPPLTLTHARSHARNPPPLAAPGGVARPPHAPGRASHCAPRLALEDAAEQGGTHAPTREGRGPPLGLSSFGGVA